MIYVPENFIFNVCVRVEKLYIWIRGDLTVINIWVPQKDGEFLD
jgi:hypothetical protein